MKAIEMFTIAQFEQMAKEAYCDAQQIEKLREVGIPKKEPWAVALCDQLASGYMFIAAVWRIPTTADLQAAVNRINETEEDLGRQHRYLKAMQIRKTIADLRGKDQDVDRAAVEALLNEGRAAMQLQQAGPIADDMPEFRPEMSTHDEGIAFIASEPTRVVFEEIEFGAQAIVMNAGDRFKMDRFGNWKVIPVDDRPTLFYRASVEAEPDWDKDENPRGFLVTMGVAANVSRIDGPGAVNHGAPGDSFVFENGAQILFTPPSPPLAPAELRETRPGFAPGPDLAVPDQPETAKTPASAE